MWMQNGSCKHGDTCRYKHDQKLKGAKAKSKPKATLALTSWSDSEDEDQFVRSCMSVEEKKSVSFAKKEIIHKYFDDPKNFGEFTVNKERKHPVRKLLILKGIFMMDKSLMDQYQHHLIDEVIIVVGPNYDSKLHLIDAEDDQDGNDKFVIEEPVPHVDRTGQNKENVMCITVPVEEKDKRFIMGPWKWS